jgi:hypothetical protein
MIDFIAGLIIGGITALIFYWYLGKDADERYQEAAAFSEQGEKRYREAVHVLEITRAERIEHAKKVAVIWDSLMDKLRLYLPSDVMRELASSLDDSCTKKNHEDKTNSV